MSELRVLYSDNTEEHSPEDEAELENRESLLNLFDWLSLKSVHGSHHDGRCRRGEAKREHAPGSSLVLIIRLQQSGMEPTARNRPGFSTAFPLQPFPMATVSMARDGSKIGS